MAAVESNSQGSPVRGSRIDGPPPLPPKFQSGPAPDLATANGPQGTPPTGQLAQVVLEHAQLGEQILVSLARMLPSLTPLVAQIQGSLRVGIVKALKDATSNPQQSLTQGAGPSMPPAGQPPAPGAGMQPPPGAGAPPPGGPGAQ